LNRGVIGGSKDGHGSGESDGSAAPSQREGALSGLSSMASVREAVRSVSEAAASRAHRSQLGSHTGIV